MSLIRILDVIEHFLITYQLAIPLLRLLILILLIVPRVLFIVKTMQLNA